MNFTSFFNFFDEICSDCTKVTSPFLFPARKFSFWNLFFKKSSFLFSYLEHWYIFWMIPDSLKSLSLNLFHSDNMKLLSVIFHGFWQFQDIWNIVSFYFCIFIDFDFVDNQNLLLVSEVFRSYIFDTFSVFVSLHKSEIFHIIVVVNLQYECQPVLPFPSFPISL